MSVVIPVMNETTSLEQTVEIILRDSRNDIREILIVVCERTTAESMATTGRLKEQLGELLVVHHQKLPFLGGALREAYDLARASHTVLMASDLETEPNVLSKPRSELRLFQGTVPPGARGAEGRKRQVPAAFFSCSLRLRAAFCEKRKPKTERMFA